MSDSVKQNSRLKYSPEHLMSAPSKLLFSSFVFVLLLVGCQRESTAQRTATPKARPTIQTGEVSIAVALGDGVSNKPVSGRLLVLFSRENPRPINGPNWFSPEPFAGVDVTDWKPGDSVTFPSDADAYPVPLTQMQTGDYNVQAILRRNPDFASPKDGIGNLYSQPQRVAVGGGDNAIQLSLTEAILASPERKIATAKIVARRSELLSKFHGRNVVDRALVLLPPNYDANPEKTYPVYYEITGFGPTIEELLKRHQLSEVAAAGVEFIHVYLTGQCQWGHHVYANSQTNGPRGDALIEEMIPAIEAQFRVVAKPYARLLGGHSSGGWSSLWLQTHYPTFFGGVWSTSPDPVDFRDWQGTNLYGQDPNIFKTAQGKRKPLAIANGRPIIWYEDFSKMDDVLERGGQLRSFEAVFSPRGEDGLPVKCWNRETGKVDPAIVSHWKAYDISDYLNTNWQSLKGELAGKIHVFTGDEDTFLLTEAVRLMKQRLKDLGSDTQIEILAGCNHFNLFKSGLQERIFEAMAEKYAQAANADASTSR